MTVLILRDLGYLGFLEELGLVFIVESLDEG
jgi:hypothetical protein